MFLRQSIKNWKISGLEIWVIGVQNLIAWVDTQRRELIVRRQAVPWPSFEKFCDLHFNLTVDTRVVRGVLIAQNKQYLYGVMESKAN